jgi:hypothetical protein
MASVWVVACNRTSHNLDFLKDFNGKYPMEVALFDQVALTQRLEKLLGEKYLFLKETWGVEFPMEATDDLFVASACQQHNCDQTNFVIVYSFTDDVLYAGIREEGQVSVFSEKKGSSHERIEAWAKDI